MCEVFVILSRPLCEPAIPAGQATQRSSHAEYPPSTVAGVINGRANRPASRRNLDGTTNDGPAAGSIKDEPPVVVSEEAAAATDATTMVSENDATDAPLATEPLADDAAVTAAKIVPADDVPASIKDEPPVVEEAAAAADATNMPAVRETIANDAPPPATETPADDAAITAAKVAPAAAGDSGGAAAGKEPAQRTASVSVSNLFGPAPLIAGEDHRNYDAVLERFYDVVKPADFVEEIWVNEVAEFTWDAVRLRRLRATLFASTAREQLPNILSGGYRGDWYDLAWDWAKGKRKAVEEVEARLAGMGLTVHSVMAQALTIKVDHFERIDRMILNKQLRRDAILREIDRHRTTLSQKLRDAATQIEDAEFEVIEPDHGADD